MMDDFYNVVQCVSHPEGFHVRYRGKEHIFRKGTAEYDQFVQQIRNVLPKFDTVVGGVVNGKRFLNFTDRNETS